MSKPKPASISSARPGEFLPEEVEDECRRAHRPAGSDRDAADRAVDPEQAELIGPRPFAARLEALGKRSRRARRAWRRCPPAATIGSAKRRSAMSAGDRAARADRLLLAAERLVEPAEKRAAEARSERRARGLQDLADPLQPDPVEGRDRLRDRGGARRAAAVRASPASPQATRRCGAVKRAAAEAAPGEPAIAARAAKPWRRAGRGDRRPSRLRRRRDARSR